MNKILTKDEVKKFREDGAIYLKNKFDIQWINKLSAWVYLICGCGFTNV